MKAIVTLFVLFVASFAFADGAEQQILDAEQTQEEWAADMEAIGSDGWEIVSGFWSDPKPGCGATLRLVDDFEPTDANRQLFGRVVWDLLKQDVYCQIYVLPDESGWVPSAENPIDKAWAHCLYDEAYCPQTQAFDDVYPPQPIPVTIEEPVGSNGGGGGCFIQTVK